MKEEQKQYILTLPQSVQGIFKKAFDGGRANAVKAKCLDCTCMNREEIRHCEAIKCPLWVVRPYQLKRES